MGAVGRRSVNLAGMSTILGLAAANVGHSCWGPLLGVCDDDDDQRRCLSRQYVRVSGDLGKNRVLVN